MTMCLKTLRILARARDALAMSTNNIDNIHK
jgi:hypothetical protein